MSGTNGPQWVTTNREQTVDGQKCEIVTFEFVDTGATLSINLTRHEVIINWPQLASSGAGSSNQLYLQELNPDGSAPKWRPV